MSINTTLAGLSTTASTNGPDGTVDAPSTIAAAIQNALAFTATLRDTKAAIGANTDITSLGSVTSLNGGQLAGLRNRIINGGMQVAQRTTATLSASFQFGSVDRTQATSLGGTGVSGAISQNGSPAFNSGYFLAIGPASWTNGQAAFQHRIESRNTQDLSGKTITVSCKLFQDTGTTRTFVFILYKANASDNFSAVTQIGVAFGSAIIPSSGTYGMSGSITLGASDGLNGLQLLVIDSATNTVVNKNYYIGDLQLELGTVATPFEQRPYGLELSLCQRYYSVLSYANSGNALFGSIGVGTNVSTTNPLIAYFLPATMRVVPAITWTGPYIDLVSGASGTALTINNPRSTTSLIMLSATLTSGASIVGNAAYLNVNNSSSWSLILSSEL